MTSTGRVVLEIVREAMRPLHGKVLGGYVTVVTLMAVFASPDIQLFEGVAYLILPVFLAPIGAYVVARDREQGMAAVLETTPLSRVEWVVSKILFIWLLSVLAAVLAAPVGIAVFRSLGTISGSVILSRVGWSIVLAGTAGLSGIIAGLLSVRLTASALTASFSAAIVWMTLAIKTPTFLALAESRGGITGWLGFVHLSPLTWAFDTFRPYPHPVRLSDTSPSGIWFLLLLTLLLSGVAVALVELLQFTSGWNNTRSRRLALAGSLLPFLILAMLSVSAASLQVEGVDYRYVDEWAHPDEELTVELQGLSEPSSTLSGLENGDRLDLYLLMIGSPGALVEVRDLRLVAEGLRLTPSEGSDFTVTLDETDHRAGRGDLRVPYVAEILFMRGYHEIDVTAQVNGVPMHVMGQMFVRPPDLSAGLPVMAGGVTVLLTLFGTSATYARMKKWNP